MLTAPLWVLWLGFAGALASGLALRYWANGRRFARVNALGVEQFQSYEHLWSARMVESAAHVLGNLLLAAAFGFFLLLGARYVLPTLQ